MTAGVNVIDTSTNYSDGASEELVGALLTELITERKQIARDVRPYLAHLLAVSEKSLTHTLHRRWW